MKDFDKLTKEEQILRIEESFNIRSSISRETIANSYEEGHKLKEKAVKLAENISFEDMYTLSEYLYGDICGYDTRILYEALKKRIEEKFFNKKEVDAHTIENQDIISDFLKDHIRDEITVLINNSTVEIFTPEDKEEIVEYWTISSFLFVRLDQQGESVGFFKNEDGWTTCVWGRETTDPLITDTSIINICHECGLLK